MTESKKTLERRINDLTEDVNKRSKAVTESRKINQLKGWLEDIQAVSLDKISKKIIEDINKEVKEFYLWRKFTLKVSKTR